MFQPRLALKASAAIALSSFLLVSCSGGGTMPSNSVASQPPASQMQSFHEEGPPATALYVSDFYGKSVFRFVRHADGTLATPAGSSLVLPYNPGAIAIGRSGNLFVADEENESIEVYRKGATGSQSPIRTLLVPFVPSSVAV